MKYYHYHNTPFFFKLFFNILFKTLDLSKKLLNLALNLLYIFVDQYFFLNQTNLNIKKKNKKIIIFGLNPKLNIKKLLKLSKNKTTSIMGVNNFFFSKLSKKINLDYYLLIHRPNHIRSKKNFNEKLEKFIDSNLNTKFFLTKEWKDIFKNKKNVYFLKQSGIEVNDLKLSYLNKKNIFPSFSNVLIGATFIAMKMQYKKIGIMGYNLLYPTQSKISYYFFKNFNKNRKLRGSEGKNTINGFNVNGLLVINKMLREWLKIREIAFFKKVNIFLVDYDTYLPIFKQTKNF